RGASVICAGIAHLPSLSSPCMSHASRVTTGFGCRPKKSCQPCRGAIAKRSGRSALGCHPGGRPWRSHPGVCPVGGTEGRGARLVGGRSIPLRPKDRSLLEV